MDDGVLEMESVDRRVPVEVLRRIAGQESGGWRLQGSQVGDMAREILELRQFVRQFVRDAAADLSAKPKGVR